MNRTNTVRRVAWLTALLMAVPFQAIAAAEGETPAASVSADTPAENVSERVSYAEYSRTPDYILTGRSVEADLGAAALLRGAKRLEAYEDYTGTVLLTEEDSRVEIPVTVPEKGRYRLLVEYYPVKHSSQSIQRAVYVDGSLSFTEASCLEFPRVFTDVPYEGSHDPALRPQQVETRRWMSRCLGDSVGYYDCLYWNLDAGVHTLALEGMREPLAIRRVTLASDEDVPISYAAYSEKYKDAKRVSGVLEGGFVKTQAEDMAEKSSPTLYAQNDKSSSGTEPYDLKNDLLNYVGGVKWSTPGQWIRWEITVPETGLYTIAFRCRQNTERGQQVHRRVLLDGALPFAEAADVTFSYGKDWQIVRLGDGETAYRFYLEAGKTHTLTLEAVLGNMTDILSEASETLSALNTVNWSLMTVLGTSPDVNRDYEIDKTMPEVIESLKAQSAGLDDIAARIEKACGQSNANTAVLRQFALQMAKMAKTPNKIAGNYKAFKDNIGALGDAILNMRSQPLALDYLLVAEEDAALPAAEPGFFARLFYQVQLFMQSFTRDYTLVNTASGASEQEPVVVWIGSGVTGGRDQAQLLNRMIEQDFLKKHDVPVQLQLTAGGTILVATLAGSGPDVALQLGGSTPVDYAMRHTVYDLTSFDDYDEVAKRFYPSALTPFSFEGGVYALPETQSFYVMFYREDILSRLGIDVSKLKTWQNIIQILGTLQESHLSVALPSTMTTYAMFLYQMGGRFYKDGNRKSALDEEVSIQAFKLWTNFYVNYQLPIEFSFENRFRLGEMPIGIADYTTYNLLSVSAPEIQGLWGIAPLPGIEQADGTINNTSPGGTAGAVIMSGCENKAGAWEFLKWWTGAEVQSEFGTELESIMGAAARYNTANVEAASSLPWTVQNRQILMNQWESAQGVPEVPGGYYTSRYVDFAMRQVVNKNASQRDTLLGYVDTINEEIALKRSEFHLD